jgi:hypothetical protein
MHFPRNTAAMLGAFATLALGCAAQHPGSATLRQPSLPAAEAAAFPKQGPAQGAVSSGAGHGTFAALDLCALQLDGAAAAVHQEQETLVVLMTATDALTIHELQRRAAQFARVENGPPPMTLPLPALAAVGDNMTEEEDDMSEDGTAEPRVHVTTYDVPVGVVIVFQAAPSQLSVLRAQLEKNVEQIRHASC